MSPSNSSVEGDSEYLKTGGRCVEVLGFFTIICLVAILNGVFGGKDVD